MTAGDVVSGISAVSTVLVFQPAAGVEVLLTSIFIAPTGTPDNITIRNAGAAVATFRTGGAGDGNFSATKIFVNNTNYLQLDAVGVFRTAYCGIQTK